MAMSKQTTLLSPLDQVMPRSYIFTALVFPTSDHDVTISRLQSGLNKTCEQLPYLKGRVINQPSNRDQLAISWYLSSSAPVIEEKAAPPEYPTYAKLVQDGGPSNSFPYSLFACTERGKEEEDEGAPVVGASCVKIDGGLVLFISMHHDVMDGTGYGDFVKLWAENSRLNNTTASALRAEPDEPLKRKARILEALPEDLMAQSQQLTAAEILAKHREYKVNLPSTETEQAPANAAAPPPGSSRIFTFSHQKLSTVKTSLAGVVDPSFLTINNILSAVVWSHISHVRHSRTSKSEPEPASTSRLGFAVNGRRILDLTDPPYLGNVNLLAQAEVPMSSLAAVSADNHNALAPIISAIAAATRAIDKTHISELVQLADILPSLASILPGWNFFNGPDLSITSWANLGLYEADFGEGVGKPSIVRIPYVPMDGLVVILPRQREQGPDERIEVTIMLREDDMETLCANEAWKSWGADGN